MNEQEFASQLSALYDSELPSEQAELVIRRALKDPQLRTSWGRYSLIGAAMRGEPLAVRSDLRHDLAARVRARLAMDVEPANAGSVPPMAGSAPGGRSLFARGALGMAIAASVAAVSLLVLRVQAPEQAAGVPALTAQAAPSVEPDAAVSAAPPPTSVVAALAPAARGPVADAGALPSYTTPVDNTPAGQRVSAPLVNYVVAHSEVAASAVRFSPLSSMMSSSYDLAQDTVEMTEAEIGAHR